MLNSVPVMPLVCPVNTARILQRLRLDAARR